MRVLLSRGDEVSSVFALTGNDENAATAALGFALSRSPTLARLLLRKLIPGARVGVDDLVIELQGAGDDRGFTDVELRAADVHLVLEAKVGIALPSLAQLQKYAPRMKDVRHARLVSVSAAPSVYASGRLPSRVAKIEVVHLTWLEIRKLAYAAAKASRSHIEKHWLAEFSIHLGNYVNAPRTTDNTVYVVSLSRNRIKSANPYTWIDAVNDGHYFHPVGNNWPKEPPNYIGFRYGGRLQAVHHVADWQVVSDLSKIDARWPAAKGRQGQEFVYTLGPALLPATELRSGNIYAMRAYVAIDLLLSGQCGTLLEAIKETKRRLARAS
jgi:hypothetical protein